MDDQTDAVLDNTPRFDEPSAAAVAAVEAIKEYVWTEDAGFGGWYLHINEPEIARVIDDHAAARVAEAVAAAVLQREREIVAAVSGLTKYCAPLANGGEGPPHVNLFEVALILRGIKGGAP